MKLRSAALLALLCMIALLLAGCGYWVVEDRPITIGSVSAQERAPE